MVRHNSYDQERIAIAADLYWNQLGGNYGRLPGRYATVDIGDRLEPVELGRYFWNQKKESSTSNMSREMQGIVTRAGLGRYIEKVDGRVQLRTDTPAETSNAEFTARPGMDSLGNRFIGMPKGEAPTYDAPYVDPRKLTRVQAARMRPTSAPRNAHPESPRSSVSEHLPVPRSFKDSFGRESLIMPAGDSPGPSRSNSPAPGPVRSAYTPPPGASKGRRAL